MNRVALLGSTGSIGIQALNVVRRLGGKVRVVALGAGRNAGLLSAQLEEFRPHLYHSLLPTGIEAFGARAASLEEIASDDGVDTVLVATSGTVGLEPTLAALRRGKTVALASKEVLVMAGSLVVDTARRFGGRIVPVDSEHSAIFQCLQGEPGPVTRLLLTASGGPFYRFSPERLATVSAADALAHPVWSMGRKITVDSATLMNKGLEVIEAHWLFGVPFDRIEVVVHPQCLVHSMVEFPDGAIKAQMSQPDMALPIQYALTCPEREPSPTDPLSWTDCRSLTFEPVDAGRFPCLQLARQAGAAGGTYPAALCGADEAAVALFLQGDIPFTRIAALVERALNAHHGGDESSLDAIRESERKARALVMAQYAEASMEDAAQPRARH